MAEAAEMAMFFQPESYSTVVQTYLEDQGIPINESETGGYSGRTMSLDLFHWKTTIQPTWQIEGPSMSPFQTDVVFNIDKAIQRVKQIPQVALKVIRMIHQDDCTLSVKSLFPQSSSNSD